LKRTLRDYAFLFSFAGIIIILDQWTKTLVRTHLQLGEIWAPNEAIEAYARIVNWKNTGAAFGIFQGWGDIFSVLSILVAIAILYYFPKVSPRDWPLRLAMGLQLGGAIGNLIDRLQRGYVTDFVSVGNFAIFNVADASISTGVVILILGMWIKEREEAAARPASSEDDSTQGPAASSSVPEEIKGE